MYHYKTSCLKQSLMNKFTFNIKFPYYCSLIDILGSNPVYTMGQHRAVFWRTKASAPAKELASMPDSLPSHLTLISIILEDHQLSRTYPSAQFVVDHKGEDIDSVTDQYLSSGLRQQNLTKVAHNLTCSVRHSIKEQTSRDACQQPRQNHRHTTKEGLICWSVRTNMVLRRMNGLANPFW